MKNLLYYFQIKTLLSNKQKKSFNFFIFLAFFTMCLEILSISLIVPIINLFIGSRKNFQLPFLDQLSLGQYTFAVLLLLILIITVKVIFVTFFNKKIFKFYEDLKVSLSRKIYSIYLRKPFEYHLSKNSATLIRNIEDVKLFVASVRYLLFMIAECMMALGVFSFILFYEPIGAISAVLFLGILAFLIYKKIQTESKSLGLKRRYHDQFRLMFLQQGFHAIKDILVNNKQHSFIEKFSLHESKSTNYDYRHQFIQTLPRLLLEWLLIVGATLLIGFFFIQGKNLTDSLPTLGLFLVAAIRLMPSITRISNSIQQIKYGEAVIDSLNDEFKHENKNQEIDNVNNEKISFNKSIEIKNVSFNYKSSEKNILSQINLKIKFGENLGLLGFSGSGKTTLINVILGLLKSSEGKILVDGKDINSNLKSWQKHIGYVPQTVYLTDDTLKQNIAFGTLNDDKIDNDRLNKSIKDAQLDKFVSGLKNGIDTKVGEFGERISGGERQRIGIARALFNQPKLLILDESTNSLDSETEEKILEDVVSINKEMTIIMIAHRPSTLSKCNRILKLSNSKIVEDRVEK